MPSDADTLLVAETLLGGLETKSVPAAIGNLDPDVTCVLLRDIARRVGMQVGMTP